MISLAEKMAAGLMLRQLQREGLGVVLLPAPDKRHSGHMIRVVETQNPDWYRELCAAYPKNRARPRQRKDKYMDSLINRESVILALKKIRMGVDDSTYTRRLMPYVKKQSKKIYG